MLKTSNKGEEQIMTETEQLYQRAKRIIPGGTQLLSKRPEMMAPDQWPAYYTKASGCEVWDLDGRHYYDMSTNGIGACALGFADPDVSAAVKLCIDRGSMCSLNPPEEVELAERLCAIHPWAEQVRFARCGGEVCAIAVRIARATTNRSKVAICGYHGWHDWYLACNLGDSQALRGHLLPGLDPLGVPRVLNGTSLTFEYDDIPAFDRIITEQGQELAVVIMEPCRYHDPAPGFLEYITEKAHQVGALVIFDEITIGWRLHFGGSHLRFGINPDLAVFAKALGNGHPIGAVIGTKTAMEGAHSSFISSTYWTERVGPVAALATLIKLEQSHLPAHAEDVGLQIQAAWRYSATKYGLPVKVDDGYPCLAHFMFIHPEAATYRTIYTQLMLERGFLAGLSIYTTLAHRKEHVALYTSAIDEVFGIMAQAIVQDNMSALLKGPVAHNGFRRLL